MEKQLHILIIEDDAFLGEALSGKFSLEGYKVTVVEDGKDGLDVLKKEKPDAVLLDVSLPTMSGYDILEAKRGDDTIAAIPVIIISNSGQPVEISRALELGAKGYIIKAQFEPSDVLSKVKQELSKMASEQPQRMDEIRKKIVWVEDDKFLSDLIAKKLATEQFEFHYVPDGKEAVSTVEMVMPDLVILDILLPEMDGFEILKRLKEGEKTKTIPVILFSNLGQKSDIDKGKQLGAQHFLVKATMNLDEVIDIMKQTVGMK